MRGRGRGGRNQSASGRGSDFNHNVPRASGRNWERGRVDPVVARPGSKSSPGGSRGIKDDDRAGLQWLPSVSRSSGLEPNGDALRSFETQQEYWGFITEKILNLEIPGRYTPKSASERQEKELNAMILLRKLREGFVATDRRDGFAIQVVENSAYLSILYNSPINIASSFTYLFDTYIIEAETTKTSKSNKTAIGLLQFLQTLIDEFPSQKLSYRLILGSETRLPHNSTEWSLASDIALALRRNNWWALEKLTNPKAIGEQLKNEPWTRSISVSGESDPEAEAVFSKLPSRALTHLLEQLRTKMRSSAWSVLRSAYREVVKAPWLERSLLLSDEGVGEFMHAAVEKNEAAAKDITTDAWILRRPVVRV